MAHTIQESKVLTCPSFGLNSHSSEAAGLYAKELPRNVVKMQILFLFLFFFKTVSLGSPAGPGTCSVDQASLKLRFTGIQRHVDLFSYFK